jgi:hypothetical protein
MKDLLNFNMLWNNHFTIKDKYSKVIRYNLKLTKGGKHHVGSQLGLRFQHNVPSLLLAAQSPVFGNQKMRDGEGNRDRDIKVPFHLDFKEFHNTNDKWKDLRIEEDKSVVECGESLVVNEGTGDQISIENAPLQISKLSHNKIEHDNLRKEFDRVKRLLKVLGNGYRGYDDIIHSCGPINEIDLDKLQDEVKVLLSKLDEDKSYTFLSVVRYINDLGETTGYTTGKSYKVNKDVNLDILVGRMLIDYRIAVLKYNLSDSDGDYLIMGRIWLSDDEFKVTREELTNVYNELLKATQKVGGRYRSDSGSFNEISRSRITDEDFSPLLKYLERYSGILMDHYGSVLNNVRFIAESSNAGSIKRFYRNDELIIEVTDFGIRTEDNSLQSQNKLYVKSQPLIFDQSKVRELRDSAIKSSVRVWSGKDMDIFRQIEEQVDSVNFIKDIESTLIKWGSIAIEWVDERINDEEFIRSYNQLPIKCVYKNGVIIRLEISYSLASIQSELVDLEYDEKIGVLDFETFGYKGDGLGNQRAFAGGWCRSDRIEMLYINQFETSEAFVLRVIKSIFADKGNNELTFYCQNLGRFDSLLLLSGALDSQGYKVKGMWKDDRILSLKITEIESGKSIKILDSLQLLKESLREVLKSFNCNTLKGIFPYRFMNESRLNYVGEVPPLKYYDGIDYSEYERLKDHIWSAKEETFKYLENDLKGLLEVVLQFSKLYYAKYNLNITKYRTLPALSIALFSSKYYDDLYPIKLVKGRLEKVIRQGYFGGNVDVFEHVIEGEAFYYDMNSQYPNAMLNDMPVGDPILTNENDLENFFGFCFGKVIPPSEERLKNLYIQYRNEDGTVSCPREPFERIIFSEEIKAGKEDGYEFEMYGGYRFNRGKGVFNSFVTDLYNDKKNNSNPVIRKIAKYSLNSLYGKFGQKDATTIIKLIKKSEIKLFTKKFNFQYISEINNKYAIIKYSSRISEKLRLLYKEELKDTDSSKGLFKLRGIPSSVHIAAAIAAYARISINKFKNLAGNKCYYSDTDSVILKRRLPAHLVGVELGQMKLELHIKKGIIIRNKLYVLIPIDNKEAIIKASGVNSRKLKYKDFVDLLNGRTIEVKSRVFMVNWDKLNINIVERTVKLKGLEEKAKANPCIILNKNTEEPSIHEGPVDTVKSDVNDK